jgi:adenosylcobinamide kinase/adenosylcobinamide-phosphate guanylyltransferase
MFETEITSGCIFFTGGAKSGKSRLSLSYCNSLDRKKVFLATAQALDSEMEDRISRHQEERGDGWETVEEPVNIVEKIQSMDSPNTVILVDCLTLWISNLFMEYGEADECIEGSIDELSSCLENLKGIVVVVTNEVGMGIVPENELTRRYRDITGSANQHIADIAKKAVVAISGIPITLKDE